MKSAQSSRGFTLLETLLVVVLIGIVALAAVPLLSSQNPTKLDVAAAEVGNALRFALGEVSMAARFLVPLNSTPYPRLFIIGPVTQLQLYVYDGATPTPNLKGPLGPGSGVVLTLGPQTVTVAINESTGLVTLP